MTTQLFGTLRCLVGYYVCTFGGIIMAMAFLLSAGGCIGYGRAHFLQPQGRAFEDWSGIPDADGRGDGLAGEPVRARDGRMMRVMRDDDGRPVLVRPEGWPGAFHRCRPATGQTVPTGNAVRVDGVDLVFPGFPAQHAGVAFSETAGEILAEYGVSPRVTAGQGAAADVYAELHLPAGAPGRDDPIDLRLILSMDLRLPDPADHPDLLFETYLIRSQHSDDAPVGAVYLRLVGGQSAVTRWAEAAGGMRAVMTIAGALLRIERDGAWTLDPPP